MSEYLATVLLIVFSRLVWFIMFTFVVMLVMCDVVDIQCCR